MSDKPSRNDPLGGEGPGSPDRTGSPGPPRRRRRGRRIALFSTLSVVVLVGAVVVAGLAVVANMASHIHRVHVAHLDAAVHQAGGPPGTAETVLITGAGLTGTEPSPPQFSGLIMLLHINADQQAGGVVSISPQAIVSVPGHGRTQLWYAMRDGGPSLLVNTVEHLTHVTIQHYARINFNDVANVVNTIGGVKVATPSGTVYLDGAAALAYAKDPALTENGRVLRQQSLIRAVLSKLANDHLLTNPVTMVRVLNSLTQMLTVDSNFTTGELAMLAKELGGLSASAGTFVTAPWRQVGPFIFLRHPSSDQLWAAINQDSIAAWAHKYPQWVTPDVVP